MRPSRRDLVSLHTNVSHFLGMKGLICCCVGGRGEEISSLDVRKTENVPRVKTRGSRIVHRNVDLHSETPSSSAKNPQNESTVQDANPKPIKAPRRVSRRLESSFLVEQEDAMLATTSRRERVDSHTKTPSNAKDTEHASSVEDADLKPPRRVSRRLKNSSLVEQEDTSPTTTSYHECVDSHSERVNATSTTEALEPDRELSQIEALALENQKLKEEIAKYKVLYRKEVSETAQLHDELKETQAKLRTCEERLDISKRQYEYLRDYDIESQMKLDGRSSTCEDDIRFERKPFNDKWTEVICSRVFKFPKWARSTVYADSEDKSTIAFLRLSGRLYGAKSGMKRNDYGDFIDSDHWTERAMSLSSMVGHPLKKAFATHAETQLIAFYVARMMTSAGFTMEVNIYNPKAYEPCAQLGGPVVIHVSNKICPSCIAFVDTINDITDKYGLKFRPENELMTDRPKRNSVPSEGVPVRFVDE